jgi:hypothetical protein
MAQWHKLANLRDIPRTYLHPHASLLHKVFVERLNRSMTWTLKILCHTVNLLPCVKDMQLTHSHHHRHNLATNSEEANSTMGSSKSDAPILCPIKHRILFFFVFIPPKQSLWKYFYFYLPPFNAVAKGIKNNGGAFAPTPLHPQSYTYAHHNKLLLLLLLTI